MLAIISSNPRNVDIQKTAQLFQFPSRICHSFGLKCPQFQVEGCIRYSLSRVLYQTNQQWQQDLCFKVIWVLGFIQYICIYMYIVTSCSYCDICWEGRMWYMCCGERFCEEKLWYLFWGGIWVSENRLWYLMCEKKVIFTFWGETVSVLWKQTVWYLNYDGTLWVVLWGKTITFVLWGKTVLHVSVMKRN